MAYFWGIALDRRGKISILKAVQSKSWKLQKAERDKCEFWKPFKIKAWQKCNVCKHFIGRNAAKRKECVAHISQKRIRMLFLLRTSHLKAQNSWLRHLWQIMRQLPSGHLPPYILWHLPRYFCDICQDFFSDICQTYICQPIEKKWKCT